MVPYRSSNIKDGFHDGKLFNLLLNLRSIEAIYPTFICLHELLHVVIDASEITYAVSAYFRFYNVLEYEIAFVAGKTLCAPIKLVSIP